MMMVFTIGVYAQSDEKDAPKGDLDTLVVSKVVRWSSDAGSVRIPLDDITLSVSDEATGIRQFDAETKNSKSIYNLSGQKVSKNYKGITIRNGKKVITRYFCNYRHAKRVCQIGISSFFDPYCMDRGVYSDGIVEACVSCS